MFGKTTIALLVAFGGMAAHAQYAAKVTLNSGNSFVVQKLNIVNGRLQSDSGQASSSLSMIQEVEFRFAGINLKMCQSMFRSGDRRSLESLLNQYVGPVVQFSNLPGNLGDYLVWLVRVQYWNGNTSGATESIRILRQLKDPAHVNMANLYFAMLLLDQNKPDQARTVFASIEDPDAVSAPMAEYIRGKLALADGDHRQAMQHAAKIIAFHSRDPEWLPPATGLEALIYQQTGQLKKAETVANELMMAYPGTQWSRLGERIKQEAIGNAGG
jgi:hypothetical protein